MAGEPTVLGVLVQDVRHLSTEMARGFADLGSKLDSKASQSDVDDLRREMTRRFDHVESRQDKIEKASIASHVVADADRKVVEDRKLTRRQVIAVSIGFGTMASGWALALLALLTHH